MKYNWLKPVVVAASIAIPLTSMADVSGYLSSTLTEPTGSSEDTGLIFELGLLYEAESGFYTGLSLTSNDVLDSDTKAKNSTAEIGVGFFNELSDVSFYDLGLTYERQLNNSEKEEIPEVYFGLGYSVTEALELSGYVYKNIRSSFDESRVELNLEFDAGMVDLMSFYTHGFEDDKTRLLEVGVGKEFIPNNYISAIYGADLRTSRDSYLEIEYTYSF
ncbi:hypothetical protein [Nitrincola schmidtii]|uniref:hypothetical protein n=1 Tax=Nitrincola schmidtii TaxID=1730894 RepID=UPI00124E53FB|nr:hypothetical protein [Nitrincola schmidtii]